ncbi:MAG: hypothetical protein R3F60_25005 [bacterium]
MKRTLWLSLMLPAAAAAEDATVDWHLALHQGQQIIEDQAFDFIAAESLARQASASLDVRVFDEIWVGASWTSTAADGHVYRDLATAFDGQVIGVHARYRWELHPVLAASARIGPAARWVEVAVTDGGRRLDDDAWTWGGQAAASLEFFPVHRTFFTEWETSAGLGVGLDLTYGRFAPVDLRVGSADLGTLDPSGPGWQLGVVGQW